MLNKNAKVSRGPYLGKLCGDIVRNSIRLALYGVGLIDVLGWQ
jgi:hypothetical protein